MDQTAVRLGIREGWVSIVINTTLFALKLWVGRKLASVSMVADAWHTLSDTLTSIVVIVGFWISAKPADARHPFGHARAESIASIAIGVLLGVVGVDFLMQSVGRLRVHLGVSFSFLGIVVFGISILLKEALAQYAFRIARKTGSPSVRADGWHHRSDAIASLLIVVGALVGMRVWWMDGVLGIGVSLLILYAAFEILWSTGRSLLGEAPGREMEDRIRRLIGSAAPDVRDVHHLHVHRYGDRIELTAHLRLDPATPLEDAHAVTMRAEDVLRRELGAEATLHVEPTREDVD